MPILETLIVKDTPTLNKLIKTKPKGLYNVIFKGYKNTYIYDWSFALIGENVESCRMILFMDSAKEIEKTFNCSKEDFIKYDLFNFSPETI